jgi:ribosomal protein L21E
MTTWTNEEKYSGQTGITYNETLITYNEPAYTYRGKLGTVWTEQPKS